MSFQPVNLPRFSVRPFIFPSVRFVRRVYVWLLNSFGAPATWRRVQSPVLYVLIGTLGLFGSTGAAAQDAGSGRVEGATQIVNRGTGSARVVNSLVQSGLVPEGTRIEGQNLSEDPIFDNLEAARRLTRAPEAGLQLMTSTPAAAAGDPATRPAIGGAPLAVDRWGRARLRSGVLDLGAFAVPDGVLPVELGSFTAQVSGSQAVLQWQTVSETDNAGFSVEHRASGTDAFESLAFVAGQGTTSDSQVYRYATGPLPPGPHVFRLRQVDYAGTTSLSGEVTVTVALRDEIRLDPPAPNPFRSTARVQFAVRQVQPVRLVLYDVLGRAVRTLYEGTPPPGQLQTIRVDGAGLASGLYVVRLEGTSLPPRSETLIRVR